jgi:hypothetical protein
VRPAAGLVAPRWEGLRLMTKRYIEHMHANQPVHTWSLRF